MMPTSLYSTNSSSAAFSMPNCSKILSHHQSLSWLYWVILVSLPSWLMILSTVTSDFMAQITQSFADSDLRGHKHALTPSPAEYVSDLQTGLAASECLASETIWFWVSPHFAWRYCLQGVTVLWHYFQIKRLFGLYWCNAHHSKARGLACCIYQRFFQSWVL